MASPENRAFRWRVTGRVQGVSFRAFTRRTAQGLGLCGWVRNLPDGSVELEACGSAEDLQRLEEAVAKGPSWARVDSVERESIDPQTLTENEFTVRY